MSGNYINVTCTNFTSSVLATPFAIARQFNIETLDSEYSYIANGYFTNASFTNFSTTRDVNIINGYTDTDAVIDNLSLTLNREFQNLYASNIYSNIVDVNVNLSLAAGTNSDPSLTFVNDTDTGIYTSNNSELSFSADAAQILTISNDSFTSYQNFHGINGTEANPAYSTGNSGVFNDTTNSALDIVRAGDTKIFISDDGLVLDSTSSPAARIIAPSSSASDPAYTFTSNPNTGIYSDAINTLEFSSDGVEKVRVDNKLTTFSNRLYEDLNANVKGYFALEQNVQPKLLINQTFNYFIDWTGISPNSTNATNLSYTDIAYSMRRNLYVALSRTGNIVSYANANTLSWTNSSVTGTWNSITYSENLDRFVICGTSGAIRYSDNGGLNWSNAIINGTYNFELYGVKYIPEISRFFCGGIATSATTSIIYSDDGITWTRTSPAVLPNSNCRDFAYSPELDRLVAVFSGGSVRPQMMYSDDRGITWLTPTNPAAATRNNNYYAVAYSPQIRAFVAAGTLDTDRVAVSYNGINWFSTPMSPTGLEVRKVVWCPEIMAFVAVGSGTAPGLSYSIDAGTWNGVGAPPFGNTSRWYSIIYDAINGRLLAVDQGSSAGMSINRIVMKTAKKILITPYTYSATDKRIAMDGKVTFNNLNISGLGNYLQFICNYNNSSAFINQNTVSYLSNASATGLAGGVLAPNGKIYMIGNTSKYILVFNPVDNSFKTIPFTSATTIPFYGGVLANNGLIYCIPCDETRLGIIDPLFDTIKLVNTNPTLSAATNKYRTGVLGINGRIYCAPWSVSPASVLIIDPTSVTYNITTITTNVQGNCFGGALGQDGNIYFSNQNSNIILRIDTTANTASTIATANTSKFAVLSSPVNTSQTIYFFGGTNVIRLRPPYTTATSVSPTIDTSLYLGGTLAGNNNIYLNPSNTNTIMIFTPTDGSETSTTFSANTGYQGSILAPNGSIYGIPNNPASAQISQIKTGLPTNAASCWSLGPSFNKL